jgi:hypothetical protein
MNLLSSIKSVRALNNMNLKRILFASIAIFAQGGTTLTASASSMPTVPVSTHSVQSSKIATANLEGFYVDLDWSVTLYRDRGKYFYQGKNLNTGSIVTLSGPSVTRSKGQHIYTWNNKGTKYQVSWKTKDSSKIRLQVIDTNRRVILNRSLQWQNAADFV